MCGFSGLYFSEIRDDIESSIRRMTSTLSHRGPDDSGIFVSKKVALGHRRLSIQDLSETGKQPMRLKRAGLAVVFNGEIYNFRDLRNELNSLGHDFVGHSDTEVILHAYEAWGLVGLKRLEGLFGLALWDEHRERLIVMRDRLGIKPVYYGQSTSGLAFGSEIKSVLAAGGVDQSLDDQAFREYLWYGNPYGNRTFFKGVRSLEPGEWMILEDNNQRLEPWWRIEEWLEQPTTVKNKSEAAIMVRDRIDQAVERQLVADVPVGIFLSGGLDSSAIAASAMHCSDVPLDSYAAGFDFDRGVNELPKAAKVARHLGLNHHELNISGSKIEDVLVLLAKAHDEPFADAANIPLYLMSKELGGDRKVVLQGDGGDELFAGYRRYAMLANSHLWSLWPRFLSPVMRAGGGYGRRFARMADSVGHPNPSLRMALLLTLETLNSPPEALLSADRQKELVENTDPFLAYHNSADRFQDYEPVQQMLLTDLTVQLPSQFLTKVDRSTMAASIEARVPLLDENVAKLAVQLPSSWKVNGTETKIILRDSQSSRLPSNILAGSKTGFGVPYQYWLRTSLYDFARSRILDFSFLKKFDLNASLMEKKLKQHQESAVDNGFLLWKFLQLSLFHENCH
ncbi:asparagine synthase (glutamine-hydrolyzing) [Opitutales bacterium]|nr:asparagine synthase (glutamine-hydrolyzing) [Opitutales bacterium]